MRAVKVKEELADGIPVYCAFDKLVEVADLKPNPRNPNQHPQQQVTLLAKIIKTQGWRAPITVSTRSGFVVRGHGRLLAARLLSKTVVPVDYQAYATEGEEYADLIADNRIAELAEMDPVALKDLILDIDTGDLDIELTGFTQEVLAEMMAPAAGGAVEDEVPEPPVIPISKPGDLWLLGKHRVLCGDATDPDAVKRLMQKDVGQMMFTDPPWNVAIGLDSNPRHRQRSGLINDNLEDVDFVKLLNDFIRVFKPYVAGDVYCILGCQQWAVLNAAFAANGYHLSANIIWVKDLFVLGRANYQRRFEPMWYGWSKEGKSSFCDRRDLDDVWEIPRPRVSVEHPTMKPIALMAKAIENSSKGGRIVIDPFGGSGSTLIAAEQTKRTCYMMEIDPKYVDVIVKRWENLTSQKAELCDA